MRTQRDATQLLNALTGDSILTSFGLDEIVTPQYLIDDLSYSLPTQTRISLWANPNPSAAAAQFTGFVFVPLFPCYLTRMLGSANYVWGLQDGGSVALTVVDAAITPVVQVLPRFAQFLSKTTTNGGIVLGAPGNPKFFTQFDAGRYAAQQGSYFVAAGTEMIAAQFPLFLEAGRIFFANAVVTNTACLWHLQFEFCAQAALASDANGVTLIPR